MTATEKEYIKKWLIKANEDIAVIEQLSERNPENYTSAICFHCQQAVEKYFKAFLAYHNIDFKKIHDLDYLLSECLKIDQQGFDTIDLKSLTDFGVSVRYPDDFYIPELSEAMEYKQIALIVKRLVEEKIKI